MECYFDNSATTRCYPEAAELMMKVYTEDYGNPSSLHIKGVEAEKYIRYAKSEIARSLKCEEREILFTSGGTESDNLALIGTAMAKKRTGNHIITTMVEHPAILETCAYLEKQGFRITYLHVNDKGVINLDELRKEMTGDTILVSIMHTNNEIGSVMPIKEASEIVKGINPDAVFHVDAVQGYGKAPIYPRRMGIDLLSVSGHKIHGPKGIGFLYISDKVRLLPIIYGGGQQGGMRSGTENVPAIAGLGKAVEMCFTDFEDKISYLRSLRSYFLERCSELENVHVNGPGENEGAPHVVSLSVPGIRAEVLLHTLENEGIYVSSGSACASNKPSVSATLKGIQVPREYLDSTVRFSFSFLNTREEIDYAFEVLGRVLPSLRKYTRG